MGMPFVTLRLLILLLFSNMVRIEFHLLNLYDGRGGGGGRRPAMESWIYDIRCGVVKNAAKITKDPNVSKMVCDIPLGRISLRM